MSERDENVMKEEMLQEEPDTGCEAETEETKDKTNTSEDIAEEHAAEGRSEEDAQTDVSGEQQDTDQDTAGGSEKKEREMKWARKNGGREDSEEEEPSLSKVMEEKIKEVNDRYARLFAEFDNFRKRSEKEKMQRYDFGVRDVVEKILPVIDNFERGLAAVPQEKADDSFVTGMEMVYKQLMKVLEDLGVKPIEAVGQEFNPDFHNAVMHVDDPEAGNNIIVEEFQKGYVYKDHVVRYCMVKVAN